MMVVELTLFGGFEARLATGQAIDLPGQKDRALLAILALPAGTTRSRDKLANLLWSDRGDQQARDSLKHSLTRLRQCLEPAGPSLITADRQSVKLDAIAIASDVATFERLLGDGTPDSLEKAAALYRGDLLEGIGIRDPAFEDWLLVERQRLRQSAEDALTTSMTQAMADGSLERAATSARRLLTLDPLRETAYRALMQIHAERSQTTQAMKLYESPRAAASRTWREARAANSATMRVHSPAAHDPCAALRRIAVRSIRWQVGISSRRTGAAIQAIDRRPALPDHDRRCRAAVFC
jgi:DNA-binding SARP family transcriptional activator